ncbi:4a-hydroxytetrahydrobiopterin dehydratase [Bacillus sp. 165]|uniref:4a-hydroxytetrahydrobiopterin dehydratase n=1 Tax=Bacillus sp. 165 TaxID=1529117 RepID=UPI001ADB5C35|nr:4a-hydroxytetrahydrobiopterin dehydratase [Bacillus sp. 165]MBO9131178.1 4a-hydroxytetrahydrobiopterin dehydratase [Bacillus sp. 165]
MSVLSDQEVQMHLTNLPKWSIKEEKWIERRYLFKDYLQGITFVSKIAHLSEETNHHPFINIQYKSIFVSLTSWNAKGLTQLDIDLAKKFDQIYEETTIGSLS